MMRRPTPIDETTEDRREAPAAAARRPYRRPRLFVLGDIRDLTLSGPTPIGGDSQFPNTRA